MQKFGFTDVRNVLERASARETAARVAGGALAKAFLRALGVTVVSHVTQIGSIQAPRAAASPRSADFADVDASPVRCLDAEATKAMVGEINVLRKRNESIGGIFELRAFGLVPGLGLARLVGAAARRADRRARCSRSRRPRASGWATASTSPAGRAPRPTTRSSTPRSAATTARPTAPAASRAA